MNQCKEVVEFQGLKFKLLYDEPQIHEAIDKMVL